MKNFIIRAITGIFYVVAVVACFFNTTAMMFFFGGLVMVLTIHEFCSLANDIPAVSVNSRISAVAGAFLFFAVAGFCSNAVPSSIFIPYLFTLLYLIIAELFLKAENPINNWAYTMLPQLYIALPLSMIAVLSFRTVPETGEVLYTPAIPLSVFIFLWCNDTGAYIVGSLIGKHKLFPRVSPGKSWEGSIGGAIVVLLVAAVVGHIIENGLLNGIVPVFARPMGMGPLQWMGLGLVVVVFGTLGDLVESLFKRTLGIKDSGSILPGHGGMLDRFDSALLAFPAAVIYLYTVTLI